MILRYEFGYRTRCKGKQEGYIYILEKASFHTNLSVWQKWTYKYSFIKNIFLALSVNYSVF